MRLSWYADTGVAVFSIWQGGTCTGTFRLPIADLPRMIDALRRGPHGDAPDPGAPLDAPRGNSYEDEPTGVYRGDLLDEDFRDDAGAGYREPGQRPERRGGRHQDDPLGGDYRDDPLGRHQDDPQGGDYRDDPLGGDYRDDPLGRHQDDRHTALYRDDPLGAGYREDPGGGYQGDPLGGDYRDDPLGDGYRDDPLGDGYRDNPRSGRRPDRRGGGYPGDPLTDSYDEGPRTARYHADPGADDYPTGPPEPAIDSRDYPAASSGNADYSPARPYVTPDSGGRSGEGRRRQRGRPADREESDSSPDSFPYGRPAAEPEPRGRHR